MSHVQFPDKGVLTMGYWRNGALIERAWQTQALMALSIKDRAVVPFAYDWEPCDPQLIKIMGNAVGEVKVYP